ncbi:MAG: hypothetical protein LZF60_230063 [Nitrospira sp.]|nr:MAG: hypothetical protein LZF60_230063 [Nitrospira sp.]
MRSLKEGVTFRASASRSRIAAPREFPSFPDLVNQAKEGVQYYWTYVAGVNLIYGAAGRSCGLR